jgi:adenylylsulfate kinase-like enzyme
VRGLVVLFTGLSGSGKSTIARGVPPTNWPRPANAA